MGHYRYFFPSSLFGKLWKKETKSVEYKDKCKCIQDDRQWKLKNILFVIV